MKFPSNYGSTHRKLNFYVSNNNFIVAINKLKSTFRKDPRLIGQIRNIERKYHINGLVELDEMYGSEANQKLIKSELKSILTNCHAKFIHQRNKNRIVKAVVLISIMFLGIYLNDLGWVRFKKQFFGIVESGEVYRDSRPDDYYEPISILSTDEPITLISTPEPITLVSTPEPIETTPTISESEEIPVSYDNPVLTNKGDYKYKYGACLATSVNNEYAQIESKKRKKSIVRYFPSEPTIYKYKIMVPDFLNRNSARKEVKQWRRSVSDAWMISYNDSLSVQVFE